jgi:hypothetical protein
MYRNELLRQNLLKELLKNYLPNKTNVYAGNEFKNIRKNKALERPDLIISNNPLPSFKFKTGKNLETPLGIELKDTKTLKDTTSGILQTQKYLNNIYLIREEQQKIKIPMVAFTTSNAIKTGTICKHFEDNKAIERFAWELGVPILINHENNICLSFRNKYFTLNGLLYGRFGKHAKFYKY